MAGPETAGRLEAVGLDVGYAGAPVLRGVDIAIPDGRITALVGPNGCGKSTLLRTLANALEPLGGAVLLDGKEIGLTPRKAIARALAILPQHPQGPDGLTVRELCQFGRHPHRGLFSGPDVSGEAVIADALAATNMTGLAERALATLSGGQRQRAWIAMALAQDTPILFLDEPTTYLDIAHQLDILHLLRAINAHKARTVVMVVHDINHAARFADHLLAVRNGAIHAAGAPKALLTPELIRAVFDVDCAVIPHPEDGGPLCVPFRGGA